jgi:hypothetical protein
MTSNDRPWDIRWYIYPGANPALPAYQWGLDVDVSSRILYPEAEGGQEITYSGGKRPESVTADYSQMSLSAANSDGYLSSDNSLSTLWPNLDLNTPNRLGVVSGYDDFGRTVSPGLGTSSSGQTWSAAASSVWQVNGSAALCTLPAANTVTRQTLDGSGSADFDFRFTCWNPVASTGTSLVFGGIQYVDANNYLMFRVDFGITAGTMSARIYRIVAGSGGSLATVDPLAFTYAPGDKFRFRCQRDGATVALKVWKPANPLLPDADEPAAFIVAAQDTVTAPGDVGIVAWRLTGNTNANAQFFFDDFQSIDIEHTGTVVKWPVEWDTTGSLSWASIESAGILKRLRQAKTGALQSTLRHQLPYYNPVGYWSLEDGPRATGGASAIAGVQPAKFSKVTPSADTTLAGTDVAVTFNDPAASVTAYVTRAPTTGTGFSVMWLMKAGTNPSSKTRVATITTSRGPVQRYELSLNVIASVGVLYVDGYDGDNTLVMSASNSSGSVTDWSAEWNAFCLLTHVSGANVLGTFLHVEVGDTVAYFTQGTVASTTVPTPKVVTIGGTNWNASSVAHLFVGDNLLPFVSFDFFNAASGFDGELASDRVTRIGLQAGIPTTVAAGTSEACGPQPKGRAVEIQEAAALTDGGLFYERAAGVAFLPRSARLNQAVTMALSVASRHIDPGLRPVRDDQRVRNKIIVTRDGGSSITVQDDTSIARVGEYEYPITIGAETDLQLQPYGEWLRFLGTRRGMRWPSFVIDFARSPSLVPFWRKRPPTPRITIATGRSQVTGNEPDLLAESFTARLTPQQWSVEQAGSDATVWDTGVWDDPVAGRTKWGPTGAVLNTGGINSSTLSIPVLSTEVWTTGAVSYTIAVGADRGRGGEFIPITNVAGPVANVYTLTASSRGSNGVNRTWPTGAAVTIANQSRWGF